MKEKEPYRLVQSYTDKYFISTAFRKASTMIEMWHFETIVFHWDKKTRKTGGIHEMQDSGISSLTAFENHYSLVKKLLGLKEE